MSLPIQVRKSRVLRLVVRGGSPSSAARRPQNRFGECPLTDYIGVAGNPVEVPVWKSLNRRGLHLTNGIESLLLLFGPLRRTTFRTSGVHGGVLGSQQR